ncbi:MAG TPA: ASKHA domain-containing protein, partial [Gaiellaceae bacterium]|nr:ASKHA domain-containing protein [Gaiellaceae bacterium]
GGVLREADWKVTAVVVDDVLTGVEPGDTSGSRHALAFDIGTTTVVATLLDLETGQPLAVRSVLNAQQQFGADVITRISATMLDESALAALQERAHETLRLLADEVCGEAGVDPGGVYEIVVTGNVTMIQLALGIDPQPLSMAPFTIAARTLPEARAADFGLRVHERAPAVLFPALGAYVGPDIVAGILATGLTLDRRVRLFIDVGTNSEIVLGSSAGALACAAPAGPAFEAAQIRCGMRAADGAIEGVRIRDGEVELTVIGDVEPAGLCGSGLVDAVAELVVAGILDHSGRFVLGSSERLGKIGEENVFHLTDSVFLSQRDVRELQFAKASIATGWSILCGDLGIEPGEISQVLLGGSFGSYLTPASAVRIGLVPKLPLPRIVAAGNVAGEGAKIAALSVTERAAAHAVLDEVEYVELSGRTDFNDLFVDQLQFPG